MKRPVTQLSFLSAGLLALSLVPAERIGGACNPAPVAVDDSLSVHPGLTYFDPLANDSDVEGQALTLASVSTTCPGIVAIDQGLISVHLASSLSSNCSIQYQVRNESGNADTGTIVVTSPLLSIFADGFELGNADAWWCDSCLAEGPSATLQAGR